MTSLRLTFWIGLTGVRHCHSWVALVKACSLKQKGFWTVGPVPTQHWLSSPLIWRSAIPYLICRPKSTLVTMPSDSDICSNLASFLLNFSQHSSQEATEQPTSWRYLLWNWKGFKGTLSKFRPSLSMLCGLLGWPTKGPESFGQSFFYKRSILIKISVLLVPRCPFQDCRKQLKSTSGAVTIENSGVDVHFTISFQSCIISKLQASPSWTAETFQWCQNITAGHWCPEHSWAESALQH